MTDRKHRRVAAIAMISAVLFSAIRGIREGMVMIKPGDALFIGPELGVRGHAWFGWYHAIDLLAMAGLIVATAIALHLWYPGWRRLILYGLATGLIVWEAFELGYGTARYLAPIAPSEHITFGDLISIQIHGWRTAWLHAGRFAGATTIAIIARRTK